MNHSNRPQAAPPWYPSFRRVARRAFSLRAQTDVTISGDGSVVAYSLRELGTKRRHLPVSRLHLVDVATGRAEALHAGDTNDVSPALRRDGQAVAFLSAPLPGTHELMLADRHSGDVRRLTQFGSSLVSPRWSARDRVSVLVEQAEQSEAPIEWFPPSRRGQLWSASTDGDLQAVSPEGLNIWEYDWAPDGRLAVIASDRAGESDWFRSRLAVIAAGSVVDLASGYSRDARDSTETTVFRPLAAPRWSADGRRIACLMGARSDRDIVGGDVVVVDPESGQLTNLTLGMALTATWIEWIGPHELLAAMYWQGEQALARLHLSRKPPDLLWRAPASIDRFWPRFSMSETGTVAATREDKVTPREIWIGQLESASLRWRQLTEHNRAARGWSHPRFSTLEWTSSDGLQLSGILISPRRPDPGRGLVVWVHGGPNFMSQHLFFGWAYPWILATLPELIATSGLSVLLPNPRGSFGWGNAFAESVIGDMGGQDAQDIFAGVDAAVAHAELDAERVGIGGWSYGGFMSAWLATSTHRFRAAVVGAGTTNWRSQHGTSVLGDWDRQYLRDDPYRVGGAYDTRSPISYVGQTTTPTLLLHGTADQFVPPGQAIELHTALREIGCPTELRLFAGEKHDFAGRRAQMALADSIVRWYARWLTDEGVAALGLG